MSTPTPLLDRAEDSVARQYYQALLHHHDGVEVRLDAGGNRGKGLFTTKEYSEGDVIFRERPLVGIQEFHSKLDTSTCANCFTAVGTVEQAFGGKICCLINELSDATEEDDLKDIQNKVDKIQAAVDSKRLEGLLSGKVKLPLTERLQLCTTPVRCRGGCDEEYCSEGCEAAAWQHHHCLLCPGPAQEQLTSRGKHGGACSSSVAAAKATEVLHNARVNRAKLAVFLEHADESNDIFRVAAQVIANTIITADTLLQQAAADASEDREASGAYDAALSAAAAGKRASQHVLAAAGPAAATASTAQVAAAVPDASTEAAVSSAAFAAATVAAQQPHEKQTVLVPADAAAGPDSSGSHTAHQGEQQQQQQPSRQQCVAALQAAFLPYAVGHKAPWWEVAQASATGSEGGDDDSSSNIDPAELAAQMKELAAESLALLRAGLQDERFPELFDLQLYGSLVGMFELNNLALTVPGPVGRYKALLEHPQGYGLQPAEAGAALQEVMPLFDALGDVADEPAEGTGFFALQSTINHSCAPNAVADCLASGEAVVTAAAHIPAGREVLLSYIEEEAASYRERQQMLCDYGFMCGCERCQAEQLAEALHKQQL